MYERTHVDLFTGIGGFTLAAHACGVRTIAMCEIDPRCRAFLAKAWPGIPIHDDVRTFRLADFARHGQRGKSETEWSDGERIGMDAKSVWLLTAGVPCQPASRAGKQRGAADDRWLWPATLAVLGDLLPTWALLENPPGIGDMDFAGILSQMAAHGYETRVFSLPACAVGAPHRRERYWLVAHHAESGCEGREPGFADVQRLSAEYGAGDVAESPQRGQREYGSGSGECGHADKCDEVRMADSEVGIKRTGLCTAEPGRERWGRSGDGDGFWADAVWLPCADGKVRRAPGDTFGLVDGLHRSVLGALGNSIVPQVAQGIIAAMIEAEND